MLARQGEIHDLDYTLYGYHLTAQQHQDYARRIYGHHYKCSIEEMDQTLIAGTAKRSDLWEEPTSLCGVKGSLPQSSQPRHVGNGGQLSGSSKEHGCTHVHPIVFAKS